MKLFISTLFMRTPNKFQNISHISSSNINSLYQAFLGGFFDIRLKDLVNEGQILNFYKRFIYKNFVMYFKISGFVVFVR